MRIRIRANVRRFDSHLKKSYQSRQSKQKVLAIIPKHKYLFLKSININICILIEKVKK